ncbi:MAG: tetratricopeptide repeat protein [Pyrinomonadaceae bacterium]
MLQFMKFKLLISALFLLAVPAFVLGSQSKPPEDKPEPAATPTPTPSKTEKRPAAVAKTTEKKEDPPPTDPAEAKPEIDPSTDKDRFDSAVAAPTHAEKAVLLKKFLEDFPDSELREEAFMYLVTARSVVGGEKLQSGAAAEAAESYRLAVSEAPRPIPDRLFTDVIARIPGTLFSSGRRAEAAELARLVEAAAGDNVRQLLAVASFYLSIENSTDAIRVAERAVELEPGSAAGYQALGFAHRLNFDLEAAARSFARAVEIDPKFAAAQRSLAEMKRALGVHDEAIAYYRTAVAADEKDIAARSGLALALFDKGKKKEAEAELTKVLEADTRNFSLRAAAAYWYASNGDGQKAVELAQRAIEIEPRYIWSHIALARGLTAQGRPAEAERALIRARQYGNFPTLDYEIAYARMSAGLFREAAEELSKSFAIADGSIQTKLGGRILREDKNFIDLLANERRASILLPKAADDPATASRLRTLFELAGAIEAKADEAVIAKLAEEFAAGDDDMAVHRRLHAASLLLQKNILVPKASEIVRSVVGSAEKGLDVPSPAAAVMASELYESRALAAARNEVLLIPDVPKQTLSAILRGRIEELAGWALYLEGDLAGSAVRLKRSISVLPEKSAWWRSSMWRLGATLEAEGKIEEALDTYLKAYQREQPNAVRHSIISALYQRVNGSTEGLEEKIGSSPLVAMSGPTVQGTEDPKAAKEVAAEQKEPAADPGKISTKDQTTETEKPVDLPEKAKDEAKTGETPTAKPEKTDEKPAEARSKADEKPVEVEVAKESETKDEKQAEVKPKTEEKPAEDGPPKTEAELKKEPVQTEERAGEVKAKVEEKSNVDAEKTETEVKKDPDPAGEKALEGKQKLDEKPAENGPPKTETEVKKEAETPGEKAAEVKPKSDEKPAVDTETAALPVDSKAENEKRGDEKPTEPVNLLRDPFQSGPPASKEAEKKAETDPGVKSETALTEKTVPGAIDAGEKRRPVVVITDELAAKEVKIAAAGEKGPDPTGATRSRVVEGRDILSDQKCTVEVSQSMISLANSGGSLGVLVSVSDEAAAREIKATSSSTRDIEITQEPAIAGVPGRRFFVIRSISEKTGLFQVNFESPCGKNEISVRVR